MSLVNLYYDPFTEFDHLFDHAFNSRFRPSPAQTSVQSFRPKMDLKQEQSDIIASFELPGMKKEDVKIDLHGDRLTISGECTTSTSREEDNYVVRERSCGSFSRTLAVPSGTKREDVKASMEHGVLSVTLPKAAEHQQPQRIDIA